MPGEAAALPLSHLECGICFELLLDPVVGRCGHDFCAGCLKAWRHQQCRSRETVVCPVCRKVFCHVNDPFEPCRRLRDVVESLFPTEAAQRRAAADEEAAAAASASPEPAPSVSAATAAAGWSGDAISNMHSLRFQIGHAHIAIRMPSNVPLHAAAAAAAAAAINSGSTGAGSLPPGQPSYQALPAFFLPAGTAAPRTGLVHAAQAAHLVAGGTRDPRPAVSSSGSAVAREASAPPPSSHLPAAVAAMQPLHLQAMQIAWAQHLPVAEGGAAGAVAASQAVWDPRWSLAYHLAAGEGGVPGAPLIRLAVPSAPAPPVDHLAGQGMDAAHDTDAGRAGVWWQHALRHPQQPPTPPVRQQQVSPQQQRLLELQQQQRRVLQHQQQQQQQAQRLHQQHVQHLGLGLVPVPYALHHQARAPTPPTPQVPAPQSLSPPLPVVGVAPTWLNHSGSRRAREGVEEDGLTYGATLRSVRQAHDPPARATHSHARMASAHAGETHVLPSLATLLAGAGSPSAQLPLAGPFPGDMAGHDAVGELLPGLQAGPGRAAAAAGGSVGPPFVGAFSMGWCEPGSQRGALRRRRQSTQR